MAVFLLRIFEKDFYVRESLANVSVGKRVTNALTFISEFPRGRRLFLMIVEDDEASDDSAKYGKIYFCAVSFLFVKLKRS